METGLTRSLIVLTDYRGQFWSRTKVRSTGYCLKNLDLELRRVGFTDINFVGLHEIQPSSLPVDSLIISQSSEDYLGAYKSGIMDKLYFLSQNNQLIPSYQWYLAHDNKYAAEFLRNSLEAKESIGIASILLSTESDVNLLSDKFTEKQYVLKRSAGATSKGVSLVKRNELDKRYKSNTETFNYYDYFRILYKKIFIQRYIAENIYRGKQIAQQFIPGLSGDYKILVFGDKFYVLKRKNRKNDFRASGSGNFSWPKQVEKEVLSYAKRIYSNANVPVLSLDVAFTNGHCYLIEFQGVMFGTIGLERSQGYFKETDGFWEYFEEIPNLERSFSEALRLYILNEK